MRVIMYIINLFLCCGVLCLFGMFVSLLIFLSLMYLIKHICEQMSQCGINHGIRKSQKIFLLLMNFQPITGAFLRLCSPCRVLIVDIG